MKKRTLKRSVKLFLYILLVVFLFVAYLYFKKAQVKYLSITNFDECVSAGYQILTTYPEKCRIPGKIFTNTNQIASSFSLSTTTDVIKNNNPKNTSYYIEGKKYILNNGTAIQAEQNDNSSSTTTISYFGNELRVDINNDNNEDSAFIVTSSNSGSGVFYYLIVALLDENNQYEGTNGVLIGDRIIPKTTEFKNGEIVVNYLERKIEEPMSTKPTVLTSRNFKVSNGTLIETSK